MSLRKHYALGIVAGMACLFHAQLGFGQILLDVFATDFGLPTITYRVPIASYQVPAITYPTPTVTYSVPVTSYPTQSTSYYYSGPRREVYRPVGLTPVAVQPMVPIVVNYRGPLGILPRRAVVYQPAPYYAPVTTAMYPGAPVFIAP